MSEPASELIASGIADFLRTRLVQAFGQSCVVARGSPLNPPTLQPEQTPALLVWLGDRRFVELSENVLDTVEHQVTIQGLVRKRAGSPEETETLVLRVIDIVDALLRETKFNGVPVGIMPNGNVTWPGSSHAVFEYPLILRYQRGAQP